MSNHRPTLCAAGVLLCLLPLGCRKTASSALVTTAQARALDAAVVTAARVERRSLRDTVRLVGTVVAEREAKAAPEIDGKIVTAPLLEGDRVRAGDVIATLVERDARTSLAAAESDLATASRRVDGAQTDARVVGTDVQSSEKQALQQLALARARLANARAQLRAVEEDAANAVALAEAALRAPQARVRLLRAGSRPEEIERARAEVDAARASVERADRDVQHAERENRRLSSLADQGFLPRQQADAATLEWNQAKASVQVTRSQLRSAEQNLRILEAGARPEELDQAQAEVRAAEAQLQAAHRKDALIAQARQSVAIAEADVRSAQENVAIARAGRIRLQQSAQQTQVTRSAADAARVRVRAAREGLAKTAIRAPLTGIVARRLAKPGETVAAGQPILEIVDPSSFYVDAAASDRDAAKVRVGQQVEVEIRPLKGLMFAGTVREILPPRGAQDRHLRVRVSLAGAPESLRVGMLANGRLVAADRAKVLAVPVSALVSGDPGAREDEVMVVRRGAVRRQRVSLGVRAGEWIEVVEGLSEGEAVVIEEPAAVADGQAVRVRTPR